MRFNHLNLRRFSWPDPQSTVRPLSPTSPMKKNGLFGLENIDIGPSKSRNLKILPHIFSAYRGPTPSAPSAHPRPHPYHPLVLPSDFTTDLVASLFVRWVFHPLGNNSQFHKYIFNPKVSDLPWREHFIVGIQNDVSLYQQNHSGCIDCANSCKSFKSGFISAMRSFIVTAHPPRKSGMSTIGFTSSIFEQFSS